MTDYRIKVKVTFTIDVGLAYKPTFSEAQDTAELITRKVFEESFNRAHLLKIETEELLSFEQIK